MTPLYPWQQALFEQLMGRYGEGKLPHALLFSGVPGLGKHHLARCVARAILCRNTAVDGQACGECQSCKLFSAGTHPDFYPVMPQEDKKNIGIDQIRALGHFLTLKSHSGGHKLVIINPADTMNRAAANSLLKNLEEPSGDTLIVLITDRPGYLLPTIRSRCQTVHFSKPAAEQALAWLQEQLRLLDDESGQGETLLDMANGAPLQALSLARNKLLDKQNLLIKQLHDLSQGIQEPVSMAQVWVKFSVPQSLTWMAGWVADMIRLKFAADFPLSKNRDISQKLQGLAQKADARALFRYLDRLNNSARLAEGQINQQLLMEDAVICWQRLFKR